MIGLSRIKRAISDVSPVGMQTGDPKVKLRLCDAQRIEIEYAALISERDAALAQNAELVAQVEALREMQTKAAIKGWWACWEWVDSDDRDKLTLIPAADQYAARVKAGE